MSRYLNIETTKTQSGTRFKRNAIYPFIPENVNDIYVVATAGDRYDVLAQQFYKDSSLWWIIASANKSSNGSLVPQPGVQLRIPASKEQALKLFDQVNSSR